VGRGCEGRLAVLERGWEGLRTWGGGRGATSASIADEVGRKRKRSWVPGEKLCLRGIRIPPPRGSERDIGGGCDNSFGQIARGSGHTRGPRWGRTGDDSPL